MHDNSSINSHLKGLIDKVTQAGSWAVWMGVFSRMDGNGDCRGGMAYIMVLADQHAKLVKLLQSAEVR